MANELYESKSRQIDEAIKKESWGSFVALHERPYRVDALLELIDAFGVSGKHLWLVVGYAWTDTESVRIQLRGLANHMVNKFSGQGAGNDQ